MCITLRDQPRSLPAISTKNKSQASSQFLIRTIEITLFYPLIHLYEFQYLDTKERVINI
jgi:hypothetical protein